MSVLGCTVHLLISYYGHICVVWILVMATALEFATDRFLLARVSEEAIDDRASTKDWKSGRVEEGKENGIQRIAK